MEVFDDLFVFSIPIVDSFNQKESTAILIIKESIQNMEIYVGNLPWSFKDQDLADAFSEFGTVDRASVITERPSGRSKGFGFVTMNEASEAQNAIEAMNGKDVEGRPLKVNEAKPREDRPKRNSDW